jgi:hypothetical protein
MPDFVGLIRSIAALYAICFGLKAAKLRKTKLRQSRNCVQRSGLGVVAEFEKLSARYDSLVKLIS